MRVLFAHNTYRFEGGEEAHLANLELGLRARSIETRRFERRSDDLQSTTSRVLAGSLMSFNPVTARSFRRALLEFRPDVVHAHNLLPTLTPSILREAKRSGVAVVMTLHNFRFVCPSGTLVRDGEMHRDCVDGSTLRCAFRRSRPSRIESIAYGIAIATHRRLRLLERWVDAFIAPSRFLADVAIAAGLPRDRMHVIHNAVVPAAEVGRSRDFALFVGRLSAEKGVATLVEAARQVPEIPIVVAGEGPLVGQLTLAPPSVRYVGCVPPERVAELRARCAFAVVPSEGPEVFPYAAIESLAHGKPVIASDIGGLPEAVTSDVSGILVPARDPARLAAAMRTLWNGNGRLDELSRGAYAAAKTRFALAKQAEKTDSLYRLLL